MRGIEISKSEARRVIEYLSADIYYVADARLIIKLSEKWPDLVVPSVIELAKKCLDDPKEYQRIQDSRRCWW